MPGTRWGVGSRAKGLYSLNSRGSRGENSYCPEPEQNYSKTKQTQTNASDSHYHNNLTNQLAQVIIIINNRLPVFIAHDMDDIQKPNESSKPNDFDKKYIN